MPDAGGFFDLNQTKKRSKSEPPAHFALISLMAIDDHTPHLHVTAFHDNIDENIVSAWRNLRAFRVRIVSLATAASRSAFVIMPSA